MPIHPVRVPLAALAIVAACSAPTPAPAPSVAEPVAALADPREQWRITFTPRGDTAYWAASDRFFPFSRQATIYVAARTASGYTTPEPAPFSGQHSDIDPALSPDGRRLYFASIRPVDGVARTDIDLWMVERTAAGWGTPVHLGPEVNTPDDELYPSVDAAGTLYWASGPAAPAPGRHYDIWRARREGAGFAPRERLGPAVNTEPVAGGGLQDAWEFNPEVSPDGRTLVFTSLRPGGHGLGDLYASHRDGSGWTPARNLGPLVNTAADEYHPTLARDGALWFVRRRGHGDFHRVRACAIAALSPDGRARC